MDTHLEADPTSQAVGVLFSEELVHSLRCMQVVQTGAEDNPGMKPVLAQLKLLLSLLAYACFPAFPSTMASC